MNSDEWILVPVADTEVGAAVTANGDLLPTAPASFLLAGDDIAVGATGHAGVQGHIQVPEGRYVSVCLSSVLSVTCKLLVPTSRRC